MVTLPTKVRLVKAMVFPVVMYGCESWTVKKAEHQRIDAFELWCLRRLLRVPWTARGSNQSILKDISPGCSLEGLMLKLELQYLATWCEELTHWKRSWCWERLKAGGGGADRVWDGWMASLTQWTWVSANSGSWWWTGRPGVLQSMGWQRVGHDWATELNWTENGQGVDFNSTDGGDRSRPDWTKGRPWSWFLSPSPTPLVPFLSSWVPLFLGPPFTPKPAASLTPVGYP